MSRASKIRFLGEVAGQGAARVQLKKAGDAVVDVRGVPRAVVMQCPDGCGDILTVNLDPRSGKAWRIFRRRGKLTLFPSVWRDTGCKSHFIVWSDSLLWCDTHNSPDWDDGGLVLEVRRELASRPGDFQHFDEIAQRLDAIPWEVSWACSRLVADGVAERRKFVEYRIRAIAMAKDDASTD